MKLSYITYRGYLDEYNKAKERIKRDKEIVKIVSRMISTKHLSPSQAERLSELINKNSSKEKIINIV